MKAIRRDDINQKSWFTRVMFFVSQLSPLIEAEPVGDLESLRYRGLLSAHIPQNIKARFTSFLCDSISGTYSSE